jgi:lysine-specific demethylase 3
VPIVNDLPHSSYQPPKKEISKENEIRYACHIVSLLLPWMRELRQEQMEEKEVEANIRGMVLWFLGYSYRLVVVSGIQLQTGLVLWTGVSMNEIKVEQAEVDLDDRVYWLVSFPGYFLL